MKSQVAPTADRTAWFREARFGMIIHWGLYSLLGRGEWAMNRERIPPRTYRQLARQFTARRFDPRSWASVARDAGMRYVVLTAKHHEGFCLWNSSVCRFNAANSAARRDLFGEYVTAVREAGLKAGVYYSLGDWSHPDWFRGWQGDGAARARFMDYTRALLRELMTSYGCVDLLWYDLPQNYSVDEWRSVELNAMIRQLQPGIVINNRALTTEDFATPEQHFGTAPKGRSWEACLTLNNSWGYRPADCAWKSPAAVAELLGRVAAGGGNLLLNVGPDGEGRFPKESVIRLRAIGRWLQRNGEAIYGVERHALPWLLCGTATVRGPILYLLLHPYEGPRTTLGGLTVKVRRASLLADKRSLRFTQRGAQVRLHGLPERGPDPVMTVVKLELATAPDFDLSRVIGGADIFPDLPK